MRGYRLETTNHEKQIDGQGDGNTVGPLRIDFDSVPDCSGGLFPAAGRAIVGFDRANRSLTYRGFSYGEWNPLQARDR